ncbi:MAG TPA: vWA domain-containing protein [Polyangia bacterium]|nr:vWA domain-containing protein [Polyangia bacterium]
MRRALAIALAVAGCHAADQAPADMGGDGGFVSTSFDLGCASSSTKAGLVPVNLIMLLDASGSMGDGVNGDPALKWMPVTDGLRAFFADPGSLGMSASLSLFPAANDICNPSVYYFAEVPLTALPETSMFSTAMSAATPMGNTPTLPAVQGAIDYAKDVASMTAGARTAIVLVTDGDPDECNSSVANVSFEVAKVATTIPTYVIGVGDSLSSLDMIAQSGGTGAPTLVTVGDANQTKSEFLAALQKIRGLVLSCDFPVPSPPSGETLDFQSVNVLYTPSSAPAEQLLYDSSCASGVGWRYDDPKNPTQIELCPSSCNEVRQDHGGRVDVVFGCATAGDPIQ